ncbi:hypothetical protein M513_11694 [Trichuris suis]|uniref:Uncharacterized protein n=1 Tax=Trichuris suis TaxID=68888 RepID=A0A085LR29_9BILA|nr:hypothetical protein M513_11694 [Trichuris suis]
MHSLLCPFFVAEQPRRNALTIRQPIALKLKRIIALNDRQKIVGHILLTASTTGNANSGKLTLRRLM